jgi:hypothetical protein
MFQQYLCFTFEKAQFVLKIYSQFSCSGIPLIVKSLLWNAPKITDRLLDNENGQLQAATSELQPIASQLQAAASHKILSRSFHEKKRGELLE